MRILITLIFAAVLSCSLTAQTTWDIDVGGGGFGNPAPYYAPQFLTIEVGDIVRWTNSQGTHNVHGGLDVFPDNPESFSSGEPAPGWVFEHTFTIAGEYDFECTQGNHNETQFGTITVAIVDNIDEQSLVALSIFPNPAQDQITIESDQLINRVELRDINQRLIQSVDLTSVTQRPQLDISALRAGIYFVTIETEAGQAVRKLLKK